LVRNGDDFGWHEAIEWNRLPKFKALSKRQSALDLGLAACLPFMLMNSSALQVVNRVVIVAVDAGPCRA
jgi:hypothetical protein